jgi:hypothetical protein
MDPIRAGNVLIFGGKGELHLVGEVLVADDDKFTLNGKSVKVDELRKIPNPQVPDAAVIGPLVKMLCGVKSKKKAKEESDEEEEPEKEESEEEEEEEEEDEEEEEEDSKSV